MSLYPVLLHLEVAFRNSVHQALTNFAGTATWYDVTPSLLDRREQEEVKATRRELVKQRQKQGQATALIADDMVAALKFGFWTGLLNKPYEQVLWHKGNMLALAFPHLPRRARTRPGISKRMHQIRQLRNRVFHHEPIWHWRDLLQQHRELRETLAWFEPTLIGLLPDTHTFDEVYARGATAHELDVR